MSKDVRLLPAVIGIGAILFALKASGVVFSATAATAPTTPAATTAPGAPPTADPTAAIHAAMPIQHGQQTATNEAPQPSLPPELEGTGVTSAEMDVLSSLADRRSALDDRERELQLRANLLAATEQRVGQKIAELKTLQTQIQQLLDQSATMEKAQVDALVKAYSGMKPADAARIFAQLDDAVRLAVASRMKPDAIAGILAKMPAAEAQKLTVELATRMKLPTTAAPAVAAPTPAPIAPVAQASTPQTMASLTPPTGTTTTPPAAPITAPTTPSITAPIATAPTTPAATPAASPAPTPAAQTQANLETPKPAPAIAPVVAPPAATAAPAAAHPAPRHTTPRHAPRQTATRAPAALPHAAASATSATEPAPAAPSGPATPALTTRAPSVTPPAAPTLPRESHAATSPPGP